MIYLDNAATTPLTSSVIRSMTEIMSNFGNPSSLHSAGRKANQVIRNCRQTMADLLAVPAKNLVFTSGGTESNNTALIGYALANQDKGKHLITTAFEHHSILETMAYLEKEFNFEVTYLSSKNTKLLIDELKRSLRDDTILVSVMYANNETGDLFPIQEIGQILLSHQAVFHVDAVQVAGKINLNLNTLNVQFLSLSAHKFHGPKGIGVLYFSGSYFHPLLHGGEQEDKHRASTENIIGIVGMTQAFSDSYQLLEKNYDTITALNTLFLSELEGVDYYINSLSERLPHVLNIGFPGVNNAVLLTQLDLAGFCVSTGSACTAGNIMPSHVLATMYGTSSHRLTESIRISFSELNNPMDVIQLAHKLKELIGK